jgi:hypothetical protein
MSELLTKQLKSIQDDFHKGLLNNLKVPKVDPSSIEGQQKPDAMLEELIKTCQEQISQTHSDIEKVRKSTNFCLTRFIDKI